MTTLSVAIGRNERALLTDGGVPFSTPFYVSIDTETMEVLAGAAGQRWEVRRGAATTGPTPHAQGATITPLQTGATQPAVANVAGTTPAGGTGATAGAYDTAAHRDALIATVAEIKTQLNAALAALRAAGIIAP